MNNHQKNRQRRKNKNRRGNRTDSQYKGTVVPQASNAYAAVSNTVTLKYIDASILKTNLGQQYVYWRMRMGDVFDPDPLILSGGISGYQECANIYRRFLVLSLTVSMEFINNETFPVTISCAPSDIDLASVITTPLLALNLAEYPLGKKLILSEKGGQNRGKMNFKIDLARFVGQPAAYHGSLQYSGLSTSPVIQTFFNIAATATSNLTASGINQYVCYSYRTLWSQRQTPQ